MTSSIFTINLAAKCKQAAAINGAILRQGSISPGGCAAQLHGVTCPLLTKSDGTKMGKTESGALWLSAERTSPYAFYQYWFNSRMPTWESACATSAISARTRSNKSRINMPPISASGLHKSSLPQSLTRLVHGEEALTAVLRATEMIFGAEIDNLSDRQLAEVFSEVPSKEIPRTSLDGEGLPLVDALCAVGLAKSKGEARRAIGEGGVYVNNRRVADVECPAHACRLGRRVDHRASQRQKELCAAAVRRIESNEHSLGTLCSGVRVVR